MSTKIFSKYLLGAYQALGIMLGTWNTSGGKKKKNLDNMQNFPELTFYSGRKKIKIKQIELYRIISHGIVWFRNKET